MRLWVLGLLVIGTCMAYHVVILADKQENDFIKKMGYLVGIIGIAAIVFTAILRVYYIFDAFMKG